MAKLAMSLKRDSLLKQRKAGGCENMSLSIPTGVAMELWLATLQDPHPHRQSLDWPHCSVAFLLHPSQSFFLDSSIWPGLETGDEQSRVLGKDKAAGWMASA